MFSRKQTPCIELYNCTLSCREKDRNFSRNVNAPIVRDVRVLSAYTYIICSYVWNEWEMCFNVVVPKARRGFERSAIMRSWLVATLMNYQPRDRDVSQSADAGNTDSGLDCYYYAETPRILTKNIKLKKQRKYLAHCDAQLIFAANFSTAPVTN